MMLNCDMSAAYLSEDGGRNWRMIHHAQLRSDIQCRPAFHPAHPNIVYASIDSQAPKPDKDQPAPPESPLAPEKLRAMTEEQFLALKDPDIQAFLRRFHPDDTVEKVRDLVKSGKLTVKDMLNRLLETNAGLFDKEIVGAQIYRSDDAGKTWKLQHTDYLDNVYSTYGYYFGDITVSPRDANTGLPVWRAPAEDCRRGQDLKAIGSRVALSDHRLQGYRLPDFSCLFSLP